VKLMNYQLGKHSHFSSLVLFRLVSASPKRVVA